jgi:hypothetical protein
VPAGKSGVDTSSQETELSIKTFHENRSVPPHSEVGMGSTHFFLNWLLSFFNLRNLFEKNFPSERMN